MNKRGQEEIAVVIAFSIAAVLLIGFIALCMYIFPIYNVWSQEQSGKAQLAEAEWSRQIAVQEAQAEKDSASLKSEAEIIRARGIAEANDIIAGSITAEYIRYKFVEGLNDGNTEVIYVPTEANIPILEVKQ